jgi:hypothetical protein
VVFTIAYALHARSVRRSVPTAECRNPPVVRETKSLVITEISDFPNDLTGREGTLALLRVVQQESGVSYVPMETLEVLRVIR